MRWYGGGGLFVAEVAAEVVSAPALVTKRNFDLSRSLRRTYHTNQIDK